MRRTPGRVEEKSTVLRFYSLPTPVSASLNLTCTSSATIDVSAHSLSPMRKARRLSVKLPTAVVTVPVKRGVVTLVVPYATVADMASGAAAGGPIGSAPYLGRTGIAAQFFDSRNNQLIAEYADTRVGRKYVVDTSQGVGSAVDTGVSNYMKAYSTWAYAQQAFEGWAKLLRARLDQAHSR